MNKTLGGLFAGVVLGAVASWIVARHHEAEGDKDQSKEHHETSRVIQTNGQTFLKLDKESQQQTGLKLAELEAAGIKPEVRSYGHVLDPAPLAALLAETATARANLEASLKEFQ